jgi:6-pyruvoyltetrahydropterin/6-carboxytetrahydropterin synthase
MFEISKDFSFSAAHSIDTLPEGHKCKNTHGHNWVVRIFLRSEYLDKHGFVVDYGELWVFKQWLDDNVDHKLLNDVVPKWNTTSAEHLAKWFYEELAEMVAPDLIWKIGVSETDKCWAWYQPAPSDRINA